MSRAVKLSARDKEYLQEILNKGKHSARKLKRARTLLLLSEGSVAKEIADKAGTGVSTVYKIWNRYFEEGKNVKKAIEESPRSGQPPKLTATVKAHVTAIACSQWTLKMISEKVAELGYVKKISTEAVRKYLKKSLRPRRLKPWQKKQWIIGEIDAIYLQRIEAVLDTYHREIQVGEVRLCLDRSGEP